MSVDARLEIARIAPAIVFGTCQVAFVGAAFLIAFGFKRLIWGPGVRKEMQYGKSQIELG